MTSANRRPRRSKADLGRVRKGLVIINTGDGKGKSTAAFGLMTRAWGRDMKTTAIQFIRAEGAVFGDHMAAEKMGIEITATGSGCTQKGEDPELDEAKARAGWELAAGRILSGDYEVVILDELTLPISFGWISAAEVIEVLERRPAMQHVVITGRSATAELIEYADLVTEMIVVKHPYADQGIKAQEGIDF